MMIDFALEAERDEGLSPRESIYQACLLRFRPIMMTTMAALLGALPLALGTRHRLRAAPAARHHDRRRAAALAGPHALHDAGHLSRTSTGWPRCVRVPRRRRRRSAAPRRGRGPTRHEHLRAVHPPARRHDAARASALLLLGRARLPLPAGGAAAARRFPDDLRSARRCPARARRRWPRRSPRRSSGGSAASPASPRSPRRARSARPRITLQFDLEPRRRRRRARRAGGDQRRARGELPAEPAQPADLPQGQPGRRADPDPRRSRPRRLPLGAGLRRGRHDPRAEALAGRRRRPGDRRRRRSKPAVRVQVDPERARRRRASASRTCAPRSRRRTSTRPRARSPGDRAPARIDANDQLFGAPSSIRPLIVTYQNGRAGAPRATSPTSIDGVENNRVAALVERRARGAAHHPPPARREHHRDHRPHPRAAARAARARSRRRSRSTSLLDRTTTIRASVARRGAHARSSASCSWSLVVFLFLRSAARHVHPERRRAAVARRHVRRHVSARLQPRQPVADGADHLDRLRRRRRHRGDREHHALHRAGRVAAAGGAQRRASRSASPSSRSALSLLAVFIPMLFMGGIVGRLFREFAVTLSVAILVSARRLAHADADDVRASC